jgi:hypothetical protein
MRGIIALRGQRLTRSVLGRNSSYLVEILHPLGEEK